MNFLKFIFLFLFFFINKTTIIHGSIENSPCNPSESYQRCGEKKEGEDVKIYVCKCDKAIYIQNTNDNCKWEESKVCDDPKKPDCIYTETEKCESVIGKMGSFQCKIKSSKDADEQDISTKKLENVVCSKLEFVDACRQIPDPNPDSDSDPDKATGVRKKCYDCMKINPTTGKTEGVWTAIGCIPTNSVGAATGLTQVGLGLAGLFTLIQIIYGAYELTFSRGDTKIVSQARKRITDSVLALLFIVFSITILRFFGVDILRIPGFG